MVSSCSGFKPIDYCNVVRTYIHRATQNSLHSVFREESTREFNAVVKAEVEAVPSVMDAGNGLLFFPLNNTVTVPVLGTIGLDSLSTENKNKESSDFTLESSPMERVTFIGAGGFLGKFIAEQYFRRGISVSILTSNAEYAKSIYVPSANVERDGNEKKSKGFVLLSSIANKRIDDEASYVSERGDEKHTLSYEYEYEASLSPSLSYPRTSYPNPSVRRRVAFEIIEGDMTSQRDLELAMRRASVVYYLASIFPEPTLNRGWWLPKGMTGGSSFDPCRGFARALDVCRRVDAHFVALSPLWVHTSRVSPLYWYRSWTSPRGYARAVRRQERILFDRGATPPSPYLSEDEEAGGSRERVLPSSSPSYSSSFPFSLLLCARSSLKRFSRPAELTEDGPEARLSPLRFSLFRLSDVVHLSFNKHMVAVKSNHIGNVNHRRPISPGNLDARLLAGVLVKSVSLCTSIIGNRIDVAGRLRAGVDMKNTTSILRAFEQFRNE